MPPVDDSQNIRSWFVFVIRLQDSFSEKQRDKLIGLLRKDGIGCNTYFPSIHLQPVYAKEFGFKKGDFKITEEISKRTIALPFYNRLTDKEINYIALKIKNHLKKIK